MQIVDEAKLYTAKDITNVDVNREKKETLQALFISTHTYCQFRMYLVLLAGKHLTDETSHLTSFLRLKIQKQEMHTSVYEFCSVIAGQEWQIFA